MDIKNIGNQIMNTWIYPVAHGWVMIDTGYEKNYQSVLNKLRRMQINPEAIRYIFLTHAHDDHAGFLEEWMTKHPSTQVVAHRTALEGLRKGQNSFAGGCSTLLAFLFCQLMGILGNGDHCYPKLSEEHLAKMITLEESNQAQVEAILNGKILFTPGHTKDSISLLVNGNLFCGDAAMNGLPSSHKITIWIEDPTAFEQSWDVMLASGADKIYPAHGKPFLPQLLAKEKHYIGALMLRPLKKK